MTKRPPKKTSHGTPRWRTRRVGSGITEKTAKQLLVEELLRIQPEDWNARFVEASRKNEAVAWARGVLEKAKLPTDIGSIEGGEADVRMGIPFRRRDCARCG